MLARQTRSERKRLDPLDERWMLVERIIASVAFRKSPRLSGFLKHITAKTMQDRTEDLTERQIGVDVFERSVTYNPGEDSIVRASARLLRGRLDQYFQGEGAESALVVRVPRGTYVPIFEERCRPAMMEEAVPPSVEEGSRVETVTALPPAFRSTWVGGTLAVLLVAGVALWMSHRQPERTAYHAFWETMFPAERRTLLVPADTTLVSLAGKQDSALTLSEYLSRRSDSAEVSLTDRSYLTKQYTSIADLSIAFRMGRLKETQGKPLEIRYTRNLTWDDVKSTNLILLGGVRSNPWTQLFQDRLDYAIHSDNVRNTASATIRNPKGGERDHYEVAANGEADMGFGLVALISGVAGDQTLLIEGTNMAGTEAACDMVLDPKRFKQIQQRVVGSKGEIHHFELLLMTKGVGGNASEPHILSLRDLS